MGYNLDGSLQALKAQIWGNGGFSHDLSIPVLDRALLFLDSCYKIPNVEVEGRVCKTNLPSNTAFRGFGGPQVGKKKLTKKKIDKKKIFIL